MSFKKVWTVTAMSMVAFSSSVLADDNLSAGQKKEVEQIVHDYLVKNPQVLVEVSEALKNKQQQEMESQAKNAIQQNADQLFNDKYTLAGNPKGSVTLVEFFDYQCIHCKKMDPVVANLIKKNSNLRVIYKEFPIFGQSSEYASQAALAAGMQGKYSQMHEALLKEEKRLDENLVLETAKKLGIDVEQLKKDMANPAVKDALNANRSLGEKMNLMGTPAFVIAATPEGQFKKDGNTMFIPGGASEEALQAMIKKVAS